MKILRILSGRHAGAQLSLDRQHYRIGSQDGSDILLTDWTERPLVLVIDEEGNVSIDGMNDSQDGPSPLADFSAQRFGDIALCVGPQDATWPSDLSLMEQMMRPARSEAEAMTEADGQTQDAVPSVSKGRGMTGRIAVVGVTGIVALLCAFTTVTFHATSAAQAREGTIPRATQLRRAIAVAKVYDALVSERGDELFVDGLLADSAEVTRLHRVIAEAHVGTVVERFAAVNEMTRSIADALGQADARVLYKGDGVFAIGGKVKELQRAREDAVRIAADLKPLVQRIEVVAEELPPAERVAIGAMLSGDGLQYVQTRDGAKHLTVHSPEPTETVLADAPSIEPRHP